MANKTWIAVALSCLIWFGYLKWFAPPMVPPTEQAASEAPKVDPGNPASSPAASTTTPSATSAAPSAGGLWIQPVVPNVGLQFETPVFVGSFSEVGAKPAETRLLRYKDSIKKDAHPIFSVNPDQFPLLFSTVFTAAGIDAANGATYQATREASSARFEYAGPNVRVIKTFTWGESKYRMGQRIQISFPDADPKKDRGYLYLPVGGRNLTYGEENPLHAWEVAGYLNDKIHREKLEKHGEDVIHQGNTQWVAFGNRYFTNAVVHKSGINPDVVFTKNKDFAGGYLRYPLVLKDGEKEIVLETELYTGPKEVEELAKTPGLKRLIDYGTFSFFAYPMLEVLRFFYKLVHNYGMAIILLTLLVRLLFAPLQMKSYASMKAMQKLQPQIAALKEKYKDDPQRFNQEQMALFKTNKVNPLGGCLPMLVQLPVFIALYALLGNSIELFHAPFFGWIQDLSSKDPYYVFPVLMGLSMAVQQKMTPTPGMDPVQAKMMLIMPVVFTFIMLNLPSGLTIYIFLSTVLGIAQQVWMNKEKDTAPKLAKATSSS